MPSLGYRPAAVRHIVMAIPPVCPSDDMQRRAAAVLIGLFLLAAVGAYALVATAVAPQITIADPAVELTTGETATVGGQAYTLSAVEDAGATLASTVADARYTDTSYLSM